MSKPLACAITNRPSMCGAVHFPYTYCASLFACIASTSTSGKINIDMKSLNRRRFDVVCSLPLILTSGMALKRQIFVALYKRHAISTCFATERVVWCGGGAVGF